MPHLTCKTHKARVMVIQVDDSVDSPPRLPERSRLQTIHRTDGAHCDSRVLRIGKQEYEPWEVELRGVSVDLKRKTEEPVDNTSWVDGYNLRSGEESYDDIIRDSQHAERGELTEPGKFDT